MKNAYSKTCRNINSYTCSIKKLASAKLITRLLTCTWYNIFRMKSPGGAQTPRNVAYRSNIGNNFSTYKYLFRLFLSPAIRYKIGIFDKVDQPNDIYLPKTISSKKKSLDGASGRKFQLFISQLSDEIQCWCLRQICSTA